MFGPVRGVLVFALALGTAATVSGGLMLASGVPVFASYRAIIQGSVGSVPWLVETLLKATPLLLIGIGMALAIRAGVWNIGGDGQFLMGCLLAGVVGLALPASPPPAALALVLTAGAAGGAAWALTPGLLRARIGSNEIIITLMLNYVAAGVILFLVQGPLKEGYLPQSAPLPEALAMPLVFGSKRIHAGVIGAFFLCLATAAAMRWTTAGFALKTTGLDARAARTCGVRIGLVQATAFVLSGAFAGLAGAVELTAVYNRIKTGMSPGYGFLGLAIAILARSNALALIPVALLFAGLLIGGDYAERTVGMPKDFIYVFHGVFLLAFAAVDGRWASGRRGRR